MASLQQEKDALKQEKEGLAQKVKELEENLAKKAEELKAIPANAEDKSVKDKNATSFSNFYNF